MFNLLVIDDEKIIRNGIIDVIKKQFNCFKVFSAADGREALTIIKEENIEGMILDIKMPIMDGLELMKYVSKNGEKISTIVLTGYDDFKFAQEALKFGAIDYILKPVIPEDIKKFISILKKELEEKRKQENEIQNLEEYFLIGKSVIKERLFNNIINGKIDRSVYNEQAEELNLTNLGNIYKVVVFEIEMDIEKSLPGQDKQYLYNSLINRMEAYINNKEQFSLFYLTDNIFVILFSAVESKDLAHDTVCKILENFRAYIYDKCCCEMTIGIGKKGRGFSKIADSYYQALTALRYKILRGTGGIYNFADIEKNRSTMSLNFDTEKVKILLKKGHKKEIVEKIETKFSVLKNENNRPNIFDIYLLYSKYLTIMIDVMNEYNIRTEDVFDNEITPFMIFMEKGSLKELEIWLIDKIVKIKDYILKYREEKNIKIVEDVKTYIKENYAGNINNKMLAEIFGYSANYLGQVFKNEMGITIREYLNKQRMDKAKTLLDNTNLLIYQIADNVGFNDQYYFSSVFKKILGISPGEYRKL